VVAEQGKIDGSKPYRLIVVQMYLAMRIEEEEAVVELEVCPVYTDAEIQSIEIEMNAYIGNRDKVPSDTTWAQHKKISANLLGLLDHLNRVKQEYSEMRDKLTEATEGKIDYEQANEDYYKCQNRIYRLVTIITDFRKQLAKILD
jgi:hypothetical protein